MRVTGQVGTVEITFYLRAERKIEASRDPQS
jgi:hypothetical protein